jgi:hypothetical protein
MNKTNKNRSKHTKNKSRHNKGSVITLPNNTSKEIDEISQDINNELTKSEANSDLSQNNSILSYTPSINEALVSLKSIQRKPLFDCNNELAFKLKEPIKIGISETKDKSETKCYPYYAEEAQKILLKNLSANKHVIISKIVPPIQSQGNCWFNTMFMTLFVSDKGRKFFHFFRQLMIEGKQSNGKSIPNKLKNGLALLNFAIDACLTGNEFAYILDTNVIIKYIYETIPASYKDNLPYITNIEEAGNPIRYYGSLMYYLHDESIELLFVTSATQNWKDQILDKINKDQNKQNKDTQNPHVIILEFYDDASRVVTNKPTKFIINGDKYVLDSCVIRNTKGHHFCSLLTCDHTELAYDGMSYHRLVNMEWKKYINSNKFWEFKGTKGSNGKALQWNFKSGYQMLVYYKV